LYCFPETSVEPDEDFLLEEEDEDDEELLEESGGIPVFLFRDDACPNGAFRLEGAGSKGTGGTLSEDDDRACEVCDDDQEDDDDDASLSSDEDEGAGLLRIVALTCFPLPLRPTTTFSGDDEPLTRFFDLPPSFPLALCPTTTFSGDDDPLPRFIELPTSLPLALRPTTTFSGDDEPLTCFFDLPPSFALAILPAATFSGDDDDDPLPPLFDLPPAFALEFRPAVTFSGDNVAVAALLHVVPPSRLLRDVAIPRVVPAFFGSRFSSPVLASEEVPFTILSNLCFFAVGAILNIKIYRENEIGKELVHCSVT
jgi:hypothetical protein